MRSLWVLAVVGTVVLTSVGQSTNPSLAKPEKAVDARLQEIQHAAESLDPDKVFSFVLQNDKGALVQNGRLFLTREEALENTRQGFQRLQRVRYTFDRQNIMLVSETVALAVGEGTSVATVIDGRSFTNSFAQTVVLVVTNGEWKVLHAHRSAPPAR